MGKEEQKDGLAQATRSEQCRIQVYKATCFNIMVLTSFLLGKMHTISANNAQCHIQANKNLWMKVPMIMRQKWHNCIEIEIKYSKSNILFKLFKVSQMLINSSENAYISGWADMK